MLIILDNMPLYNDNLDNMPPFLLFSVIYLDNMPPDGLR